MFPIVSAKTSAPDANSQIVATSSAAPLLLPAANSRPNATRFFSIENRKWLRDLTISIFESTEINAHISRFQDMISLYLEILSHYQFPLSVPFRMSATELFSLGLSNTSLNAKNYKKCSKESFYLSAVNGFSLEETAKLFQDMDFIYFPKTNPQKTVIQEVFQLIKKLPAQQYEVEVASITNSSILRMNLPFLFMNRRYIAAASIAMARFLFIREESQKWPKEYEEITGISLEQITEVYDYLYNLHKLVRNNAFPQPPEKKINKIGFLKNLLNKETELSVSTKITDKEQLKNATETLVGEEAIQPPSKKRKIDEVLENTPESFKEPHSLTTVYFKDVLPLIFAYLGMRDLKTTRLVCQYFYHSYLSNPPIWYQKIPYEHLKEYQEERKKLNWSANSVLCFFPNPYQPKPTSFFFSYPKGHTLDLSSANFTLTMTSAELLEFCQKMLNSSTLNDGPRSQGCIKEIILPVLGKQFTEELILPLMDQYPDLNIGCPTRSLLHWACYYGMTQVVDRILQQIDQKKGAFASLSINTNNGHGTPILAATMGYPITASLGENSPHWQIIHKLLEKGASLNCDESNITPCTPLIRAIVCNFQHLVELFVDKGAKITESVVTKYDFGLNAIRAAEILGRDSIAKLLIANMPSQEDIQKTSVSL